MKLMYFKPGLASGVGLQVAAVPPVTEPCGCVTVACVNPMARMLVIACDAVAMEGGEPGGFFFDPSVGEPA
jgi:hypothetical protein